jgi:hypothetical protein
MYPILPVWKVFAAEWIYMDRTRLSGVDYQQEVHYAQIYPFTCLIGIDIVKLRLFMGFAGS